MGQLTLLLWKNYTLKKRAKWATAAELLVPLFLFLLLAWVRRTRPAVVVQDQIYNTLALPSSGLTSLVQSLYCGGIAEFDASRAVSSASSTLDEIADILDDYDITPERISQLIQNITIDERDLNSTLNGLGYTGLNDLLDDINVNLPTLTSISFGNGSSYDWNNQTQNRENVQAICDFLTSSAFTDLRDLLTNTSALNGTTSGFARNVTDRLGLDLVRIALSSDPQQELIRQWRESDFFINTTAPEVLQRLNEQFPNNFNFTNATISQAQDTLRAARTSGTNTTVLRQQLTDVLSPNTNLANTAVAALIGLNSVSDTRSALQQLLDLNNSSDIIQDLPQTALPVVIEELERLQNDLIELEQLQEAYDRIMALDGIKDLRRRYNETGSLTAQEILSDIACPNVGIAAFSGSKFVRRDADDTAQHAPHTPDDSQDGRREVKASDSLVSMGGMLKGFGSTLHRGFQYIGLKDFASEPSHEDSSDASSSNRERREDVDVSDDSFDNAQQLLRLIGNAKIYYAPNTSEVNEVIRYANRTFEQLAVLQDLLSCIFNASNTDDSGSDTGSKLMSRVLSRFSYMFSAPHNVPIYSTLVHSFINKDISLDLWKGYSNATKMIEDAMGPDKLTSVLGAVHFQGVDENGRLPKNLTLSIRLHRFKVPATDEMRRRYVFNDAGTVQNSQYYYLGFVMIQDLIQRAFLDFWKGEHMPSPGIYAQQFPVPTYREDQFAWGISRTLPLFMVLAWIYSVSMICKAIVYEKENRLKEAMKMMGLSGSVHWIGWFITSVLFMTCSVLLLTLILVGGGILGHSSPVLIFIFLEVFAMATIALSFLISVFFSRARLAAACAGIIYFVTYLPYIYVAIMDDSMKSANKWLASLSSTTAFGIGSSYIAKYEEMGVGLQWSNFMDPTGPCDNFKFSNALLMMLVDFFIYSLLTWYLDKVMPGYGIPMPWYFPLRPQFWFPSWYPPQPVREDDLEGGLTSFDRERAPDKFERMSEGPFGVRIVHLSKTYDQGWCSGQKAHTAVDDLTFYLRDGSITALLGHNGAGKTTTMSILTGLFPPSSGTAYINGMDIRTNMNQIRKSLGICPQYNVLFDRLTVREHLWFCAKLKNIPADCIDAEIKSYLKDIGLEDKEKTYAMNLSGGMKRKLSVVMSFIGGSKVVILDEPTAGMDPSARRATWDLLLKYRKGRTILLSTHHLDEADLLSERIGILAYGRLRCDGSPLFLKKAYAATYTLAMAVDRSRVNVQRVTQLVTSHVPNSRLVDNAGQQVSFSLPAERVDLYSRLLEVLEKGSADLGILSFGVSATTLEDVFVKVAEEAELESADVRDHEVLTEFLKRQMEGNNGTSSVEMGNLGSSAKSTSSNNTPGLALYPQEIEGVESLLDESSTDPSPAVMAPSAGALSSAPVSSDEDDGRETPSFISSDGSYVGDLLTGWRLRVQRFVAMIAKRLHHALRDRRAVFSQIFLPAAFVALSMLVATAFPPPEDLPPLSLTPVLFKKDCSGGTEESTLPFANLDVTGANAARHAFAMTASAPADQSYSFLNLTGDPLFEKTKPPRNFTAYILETFSELQQTRESAYTFEEAVNPVVQLSSSIETGTSDGEVARAWFDNRHFHSLPISLAVVHNALLRSWTGDDAVHVDVVNHPLPDTAETKTEEYLRSGTDLTVGIMVIIALSFVPASFVLFVIQERTSKAKHLQMVSGVTNSEYWIGNFVWDMFNYVMPALICLVIFLAFDLPAYTGRNFGAVVALLLLYGWGITPLMYAASFLFDVPSTGYVTLICLNLFVGLTSTLATFVLELFPDEQNLLDIAAVLRWAFLVFPNYCLGRGLMDIATNEYVAQYYELIENSDAATSGRGYKDPFAFNLIGRNLFFMFIMGIFGLICTLLIEYWNTRQTKKINRQAASSSTTPNSDASQGKWGRSSKRHKQSTDELDKIRPGEDADVAAERVRVMGLSPSPMEHSLQALRLNDHERAVPEQDVLVIKDLYKVYGRGSKAKAAVNGLSLGVPRGECFGLLGVNGAGKTSTFKMLTADTPASGGEAWIAGYSILLQQGLVRQHCGYCPQFDALNDLLTGRETLYMYARLRGIPQKNIKAVVDWTVRHMQLTRWADRVSRAYSGGNKRKLSVAIALLGRSELIFLDEPTAGIDFVARKFLWNLITGVVKGGRCVILTSHAMDECQALCSRLAIMVNGRFRCLGSPQHLKSLYGEGYTVIAKVKGSPPDTEPLTKYMEIQFPGSSLKECHNGYVRYQIPTHQMPPLSVLFDRLEAGKTSLNIEDYSISQTSLDQIFCNFAAEQEEHDDDHKASTEGENPGAVASSFTNPIFNEYASVDGPDRARVKEGSHTGEYEEVRPIGAGEEEVHIEVKNIEGGEELEFTSLV